MAASGGGAAWLTSLTGPWPLPLSAAESGQAVMMSASSGLCAGQVGVAGQEPAVGFSMHALVGEEQAAAAAAATAGAVGWEPLTLGEATAQLQGSALQVGDAMLMALQRAAAELGVGVGAGSSGGWHPPPLQGSACVLASQDPDQGWVCCGVGVGTGSSAFRCQFAAGCRTTTWKCPS